MGYPVWRTLAGDLGKVTAQQFFDLALEAFDPDGVGTITFELVAGQLPKGLQVASNGYVSGNPEKIYVLQGVPVSTNKDILNEFTIRAKNSDDNSITDRTFNITITGNFAPQIVTIDNPLGTYLDGTEIRKQLEAIDLNSDTLTWSISSGSLPPGLELSSDGLISGVIQPAIYNYSTSITGWDNSRWDINPWQFTTIGSNQQYNFTVGVTDGKVMVTQKYTISVYAKNDVRADSIAIYADNVNIYADADQYRPAVLLTTDLGKFATVNSGGYFAFQFEAVDYDVANITYILDTSTGYTWDSETTSPDENSLNPMDIIDGVGWDMGLWDRNPYVIPPGLVMDPNTGWLTGYIPYQYETIKTYEFGVYVYGNNDPENKSPTRQFKLNVLGNLDLAVNWTTPSDLGTVKVGSVSNLSVEAYAVNGRELTYSLVSGSKLPQGLKLLNDGTISGRISFQAMGFDRGKTTFDKALAAKFVYPNYTNFDNFYTFTVIATDFFGQLSSQNTFNIRLDISTYEPYEDLYARCLPTADNRQVIQQIVNNTDIFDPAEIYRPTDPYYGSQLDIRFLVSYGIKASLASDYISAMKARHYNKKFYFGDYKLAQGKDTNGTVLYDVIYVDLIEDTKIYQSVDGIIKNKIPAASTNMNATKAKWRNPRAKNLPQNQVNAASSFLSNNEIKTNDTYYLNEALNVVVPNDLTLMQMDISSNLENSYLNSLPEWMVSVQSDGKILGYTSGAPLVYLKPGAGAKALFNIKRFAPFDIKTIPLVIDRYILNNSYTNNFDIATRRFISHKYTTFDIDKKGFYTYNGKTIVPAFDVDFIVDRPFNSINGQTIEYILNTGGLDGITYNISQKYLIFGKQEFFEGWATTPLENDGWEADGNIIPGYTEKVRTGNSATNQRGGVWRITVDETNVVTLNFVKELQPGDIVYVIEGFSKGNSYQLYDLSVLNAGYTVPSYTELISSVYQTVTNIGGQQTTFDSAATIFINNVDTYTLPGAGDKYLKFPKIGVFNNDQ